MEWTEGVGGATSQMSSGASEYDFTGTKDTEGDSASSATPEAAGPSGEVSGARGPRSLPSSLFHLTVTDTALCLKGIILGA